MLNDIKIRLGIYNTQFDTIINNFIEAGKRDLIEAGIVQDKVVESDALIYSALMNYVLSMMGDNDSRELSANAYNLRKDELRHLADYIW